MRTIRRLTQAVNLEIRVQKAKRNFLKTLHPIQVYHRVWTLCPGQILLQETLEQVDPPSSAQHVVSTHTGERTAHMIIFAQHVIIMIMPHTCVEPHARALQSAFTVATLTTGQVIAPETHGTTENNCMQHLTL